MRIDHMAVRHDLVRDVADKGTRDRESDPGGRAAELGIGRRERGEPTTSPRRLTSAPPLLPGLRAALVWITFRRTAPAASSTVRPSALMMPSVTELRSPSGLPMRDCCSCASALGSRCI